MQGPDPEAAVLARAYGYLLRRSLELEAAESDAPTDSLSFDVPLAPYRAPARPSLGPRGAGAQAKVGEPAGGDVDPDPSGGAA